MLFRSLKNPESLLKKDRDKALSFANNQEGVMQAIAVQDGIIAVSVIEWSFDLIPPSIRIASLGELTPKDYTALLDATSNMQEYLFPVLDATEASEKDPKADTANFND